jgi:hypothetical protein
MFEGLNLEASAGDALSWLGFQHVGLCGLSWAAHGFIVRLKKKSSGSYI